MPLFDENGNEVSVDEVIKSQGIRDQLKEAEKTRAENEALKIQLEQTQRESALTKLGVSDTGHGALIRKLIDGEPTEAKVKAIAEEYGLELGTPASSPQSPAPSPAPAPAAQTDPTLGQLRQIQGAVGSSAGQSVDPLVDAYTRMSRKDITQDEVMEIVREVKDKGILTDIGYTGERGASYPGGSQP